MRSSVATVASRSTKDGRTGTTMRSAALAATLAAVSAPTHSRRCVEVHHVRTGAGDPLPLGTKPAWRCCQYHRRRGSATLTPPGGRTLRVKVQHRDVAALLYVRNGEVKGERGFPGAPLWR